MSEDLPFNVIGRRDDVDLDKYKEGDGNPEDAIKGPTY